MTNKDLKDLRLAIGFSMSDIAVCLGVPKSTYQRYEDGTAAIPDPVERAALELKTINEEFIATAPARIDARINREFPGGIMSEVGR